MGNTVMDYSNVLPPQNPNVKTVTYGLHIVFGFLIQPEQTTFSYSSVLEAAVDDTGNVCVDADEWNLTPLMSLLEAAVDDTGKVCVCVWTLTSETIAR